MQSLRGSSTFSRFTCRQGLTTCYPVQFGTLCPFRIRSFTMKFKFNLLVFVSIGVFVVFVGYSRKSFGNDLVTEHVRLVVRSQVERSKFLLVTMVNKGTGNFKRFQRSARVNGLPLKVLGLGQEYKGWGEKVHWLTKEMEPYKNDSEKIIMFADGFDVLLNAGIDLILEKFYRFNARVVFSGTRECYPMDLLPK